MSSEPTAGELGRRLDDIKADYRRIADKMDSIPDHNDLQSLAATWLATLDKVESGVMENRRRLEAVEAWQTWALRLLVGAIITAAVGALLAYGRW